MPVVQIELKTLGINSRRAIEQIVDYKNDPGNGYTRMLLCFVQLFKVSNRDSTYHFANKNARHFSFNADERFLPIYQYAAPDNSKISGIDRFAEAFLAKCTLGKRRQGESGGRLRTTVDEIPECVHSRPPTFASVHGSGCQIGCQAESHSFAEICACLRISRSNEM